MKLRQTHPSYCVKTLENSSRVLVWSLDRKTPGAIRLCQFLHVKQSKHYASYHIRDQDTFCTTIYNMFFKVGRASLLYLHSVLPSKKLNNGPANWKDLLLLHCTNTYSLATFWYFRFYPCVLFTDTNAYSYFLYRTIYGAFTLVHIKIEPQANRTKRVWLGTRLKS